MKDLSLVETAKSEVAMGHLGRITSLKELPADKKMIAYIKEAMELTDKGIKLPSKTSSAQKKEYLEWITDAKTEATRNKRMETALEWMAEGKSRNWKYK